MLIGGSFMIMIRQVNLILLKRRGYDECFKTIF